MKELLVFFLFFITSNSVLAFEVDSINIIRGSNGEIDQKVVLPFDQGRSLILKEVWRSPSGIVCKVSIYEQNVGVPKGTFECQSVEGYKAQIGFDCSENQSKDSSEYLFFGLIGKNGNIGNFYVWCE